MKRIAIHSVPRSGSTWLGTILDSSPEVVYRYQPLFSYKFKDVLGVNATNFEIKQFFNEIAVSKDKFITQSEEKEKNIVPEFYKNEINAIVYKEVRYHHIIENLLATDKKLKVLGLVRNPCAVINSWLKAPKEFKQELGWKVEEEWRTAPRKNLDKPEEFNGFEKWKEVSLLFEQLSIKYPDRFMLIDYEHLLRNTKDCVVQIFNFVELEMSNQTIKFIESSKSKTIENPYSVYKKKDRDNKWIDELPQSIINDIIEDIKDTTLFKYVHL